MNAVRLGGYQGDDSILTAGLLHMAQALRSQRPQWIISMEQDVTSRRETARSLFTSIDCGVRQLGYMASGYLAAKVPELALLDLPFAIQDRQAALQNLDGNVGKWLSDCIERRTGYKMLGFWDNGFRHISNNQRPILSATDCAGLRIRTLDSETYRQSLSSLGFSPQSIDVKDFVQAMKAGNVDAQENPLANFALFSVGKYHSHLSLSAHFFGVLLLICHRPWFEALPAKQQADLQDAARLATAHQRQLAAAEDAITLAALQKRGTSVVLPHEIDLASMHQATQTVRDKTSAQLPPDQVRSYVQHLSLNP